MSCPISILDAEGPKNDPFGKLSPLIGLEQVSSIGFELNVHSIMSSEAPKEPQFLEHACDATRMLHKRRQLFDIKERFAAEKEKYDERCKILREKDAEITQRDLEFQAKLVRLKIFTQNNELKSKKLSKRFADEVKICDNLDEEVEALSRTLDEKQRRLKELEELVERQSRERTKRDVEPRQSLNEKVEAQPGGGRPQESEGESPHNGRVTDSFAPPTPP